MAYSHMVDDRVRAGWSPYLVTIVFSQLGGQRSMVLERMRDEVQRIYSTLVTRVHRKPKDASPHELPVLIGAFDFPVYKRNRTASPLVLCNGGLHFHAVVLIPPVSRLRVPLSAHFEEYRDLYVGTRRVVVRVDVRSMDDDHERVVDYVFKTVQKGRLTYDDATMVLPRAPTEL